MEVRIRQQSVAPSALTTKKKKDWFYLKNGWRKQVGLRGCVLLNKAASQVIYAK